MLRELGARGMAERVARHRAYAARVTAAARAHPRLEALVAEPELSVACFRYRPEGVDDEAALDTLNRRLLERLRRETTSVPTSTVVAGRFALRPCFVSPRTSVADVDALVDAVVRLGDDETATRPRA